MSKEAMKLALEKFANAKALCDKHGDKINRKHVYGGALIEHFDVVCQALAEQPAQQEPVAWADLNALTEQFNSVNCGTAYRLPGEGRQPLYTSPPAQQEPVAWRDHVEQRLLTWRQSFVNRSGDQLALDDFMDKQSLDDLIDFVCDEYTSPPASKPWVGLTYDDLDDIAVAAKKGNLYDLRLAIEAKLREKNT